MHGYSVLYAFNLSFLYIMPMTENLAGNEFSFSFYESLMQLIFCDEHF